MLLTHYPEGLSLAEYLQIEQDLVNEVKEATLFTWIVSPTVIYGRHQSAEAEVNEEYCREHGIAVVQRKSGGGCVYADRGNVMLSFILPSTHSEQVFAETIHLMADALQRLGYEAVTTEHNDILVNGRKVSGSACYTSSSGTIVHSTMLYDVDFEALHHAITPSQAKLAKHAVQSVRQRVMNLKELQDLGTTETFRRTLEQMIITHND